MDKIIFLHGFNSIGNCRKSQVLTECLPEYEILSPDLPTCPMRTIELVRSIYDENYDINDNIHFIGCNLGAFYALYISYRYGSKSFLVDPIIEPSALFYKAMGTHFNWLRRQPIVVDRAHVDYILFLEQCLVGKQFGDNIHVALNTDDTFHDYNKEYFTSKECITHSVEDAEDSANLIEILVPKIRQHF